MTPEFTPISLKHVAEYQNLLHKCGSRASDYSFGNLWGWGEYYGLEWRTCGSMCWLRQTKYEGRDLPPDKIFNWAPVGQWEAHDWAKCIDMAGGLSFIRVPEKLLQIWQKLLPAERIQITESRGQWDYLYNAGELAELSGNRFHKKKNLLNQFNKNYDYRCAELTSDCVESVLQMQDEWSKWREIEESPSLLAENQAVYRVLELWDSIPGLVGSAIHMQGRVVAYTVGEAICPDTMVVHFEKGMPGYKGIYQAINNCFARQVVDSGKIQYLNREQDLDDEGLRKAKESYNPVDYVKKYSVKILPA